MAERLRRWVTDREVPRSNPGRFAKFLFLRPLPTDHFTFSFADCGPSRRRILMFYTPLEPHFCVEYELQGFLLIRLFFLPQKAKIFKGRQMAVQSRSTEWTSPLRKRRCFNHFRGSKIQPRDKETKSKSRRGMLD